ncbi:DUF6517 family protein [Halalkalicoccus ordinarius]|uniref:DUF6517 family protein n=1 Tax=Halalkalicoccus ordinarius TaxID=3116651 RepID=UPI00300EF949
MTTRRSVLLGAVAGLTATAGCLEFALGTAPLETEATTVTVADGALAETEYEVSRSDRTERSYTVTVAGQPREIEATCHVSEYRKRLSVGPLEDEYLGTFGVISAPRTELFGRTSHPLEGLDDRRLVADLQSEYDRFETFERVGTDAVRVLGDRREVAVHRAEAVHSGESIDVSLHVLSLDHGEDRIDGVGVHPTSLSGERQRILSLFERIQHG